MPWIIDGDRTARHLDWDDPRFQMLEKAGEPYWGTLLGAVRAGGVAATVFDHAIRVEPLYDARVALETWPKLPAPSGARATYKITHFDGRTYFHGKSPADLLTPKEAA